jgi:hypothetical protein
MSPCYGVCVPLLLVDPDNTLVDRAGAFGRWAREFVSARGGTLNGWYPPDDPHESRVRASVTM